MCVCVCVCVCVRAKLWWKQQRQCVKATAGTACTMINKVLSNPVLFLPPSGALRPEVDAAAEAAEATAAVLVAEVREAWRCRFCPYRF
jgi:hypothetical protein